MKRKFLSVFSILALAALTGACGVPGVGSTTTATPATTGSQTENIAGGVLGAVLGSILEQGNQLSQADLIGTWNYEGASCKFESENLLKQAGGEFIASSVEAKVDEYFAKIGIKKGMSSITFAEDGTYQLGSLIGTYEFDQATGKIVLKGTLGLMQSDGYVVKDGNGQISILYSADKILQLMKALNERSNNTSIKTLSSLLGSYDGIKVGMRLKK